MHFFYTLKTNMEESIATLRRLLPEGGEILRDLHVGVPPPDINDDLVLCRSDTSKVSVLLQDSTRVLKMLRDRFVKVGIWVARDRGTGDMVSYDYDAHNDLEDKLFQEHVALSSVTVAQEHGLLLHLHDRRQLECTEFLHEVMVGAAMSRALTGITPHVTQTLAAHVHEGRGYLVMQRAHGTLREALMDNITPMRRLGPTQVAIMYFQIMHAVACAQAAVKFKHHDLHLGNVFLHDTPDAWRGATHLAYTVGSSTYYLPNTVGVMPCLSDFGLASVELRSGVRLARADLEEFGNSDRETWGEWTPKLDGQRGYDLQVLFADLSDMRRCRLFRNAKLQSLHARLHRECNRGGGVCAQRPSQVCDMPPSAALQAVFSGSPEPDAWWDFRQRPPAPAVVVHVASVPLEPLPPGCEVLGVDGGKKNAKPAWGTRNKKMKPCF